MKRIIACCVMALFFGLFGTANASLTTIGTATYMGSDYNLIYEDDSIDGGLVWLDYTNSPDTWQNQINWASGIGGSLTVNLLPGYTTDIDWGTGWRLPLTQDQTDQTSIYNQTGSEMGHLYYDSLGKPAHGPLGDTSPFNKLQSDFYWSGTEYSPDPNDAWYFYFDYGFQNFDGKDFSLSALAVRPGQVSAVPIPSAIWLLGSGLVGIVGFRRKFSKT